MYCKIPLSSSSNEGEVSHAVHHILGTAVVGVHEAFVFYDFQLCGKFVLQPMSKFLR